MCTLGAGTATLRERNEVHLLDSYVNSYVHVLQLELMPMMWGALADSE